MKNRAIKEKKWFQYYLFEILSFFGKSKFIKKIFRFLVANLSERNYFKEWFNKYNPIAILSLDIKQFLDTQMLIEGNNRDIETIGMVRSWDNITAKGIFRVFPKHVIVHNSIIKKEVIEINNYPSQKIEIVGIPYYDPYFNFKPCSKESLFAKIGCKLESKLIVYAPFGQRYSEDDQFILKSLDESLSNNKIIDNVTILVRFPPGDKADIDAIKFKNNFIFEQAGTRNSGASLKDSEMTRNDVIHLGNLLYHANLVISGPSTFLIDSMVFDKPSIAVAISGEPRGYYLDSKRFYDYEHMSQLYKNKPFKLVQNMDELISSINEYLIHGEKDRENRRKSVIEQSYILQGDSSLRMARYVVSICQQKQKNAI